MKSVLSLSVFAAFLGLAHSQWAPSWPAWPAWTTSCISQSAAETLVAEYAAVIAQQPTALGDPTTTAYAITTADYYEQSDSANVFIGLPLGSLTAPSQAVFAQESQSNPPLITTTLGVYAACTYVTWQWTAKSFGSAQYEVNGFHLFAVTPEGQIENTHFEFNSVAAALDTGITDLLNLTIPAS